MGGADEDAVQLEAPHRHQRGGDQPGQVRVSDRSHGFDIRQNIHQGPAGQRVDEHVGDRHQHRQSRRCIHRGAEIPPAPAAVSMAGERFDGMRKTVQTIGQEMLEVQQHRVCSQHVLAEARADYRKVEERRSQAQRANGYVDIDNEQRTQLGARQQRRYGDRERPFEVARDQDQADTCRNHLCNDRSGCHTGGLPIESVDEHHVQHHVRQIQGQLVDQRGSGPLQADQTTEHRIVRQRGRRAPHADLEIGKGLSV